MGAKFFFNFFSKKFGSNPKGCIFEQTNKTNDMIKLSTIENYRSDRERFNPKGDCAVRAFAVFFDINYNVAREWLNKFNPRDCVNGTYSVAIEKAMHAYAETRGIEVTKHYPSRNMKVKSLVSQVEKAYISARGHATACVNGVHYSNVNQEEADSKKYRDDANQFVKSYWTMKVVDVNKYLSGGVY